MQRRGLGIGFGKGYYNIVPRDPYIHSLSARGIKTTYNTLQKLSPLESKKLLVGMAYGKVRDDIHLLDFKFEDISSIDEAKEIIKEIGFYNNFDYRKVNRALDKVGGDLMSITIGRESSPVIYLELPYFEGQKYNHKKLQKDKRLSDEEIKEIYYRVKKEFSKTNPDEFSVGSNMFNLSFEEPKSASEMMVIRLWWD